MKPRRYKIMKKFALLFISLAATTSFADVIYNTYAEDGSFMSQGWLIDATQSIATPFEVTQAVKLDAITLSFNRNADITISLAKGGSIAPGERLMTWNTYTYGTTKLTPSSTLVLGPGSYYVVAESPNDSTGWCQNSIHAIGDFSSYHPGSNWYGDNDVTGVMKIEATPVPEPASMLALGMGSLALLRRRRK